MDAILCSFARMCVCVWDGREKRRGEEEENVGSYKKSTETERQRERKSDSQREREKKIYLYIQPICLTDSGSSSAKGNKTELCGITVCLCAEKILFW